jgi:O-acetylhomoserine/O-acetylserine sulfhydrylase-like pyridoxal-dependent enzyme
MAKCRYRRHDQRGPADLARMSVGIESVDDLPVDLEGALDARG